MLQEFERDKGGDWRSSTFQDETLKSQYRDVLDTYEIQLHIVGRIRQNQIYQPFRSENQKIGNKS